MERSSNLYISHKKDNCIFPQDRGSSELRKGRGRKEEGKRERERERSVSSQSKSFSRKDVSYIIAFQVCTMALHSLLGIVRQEDA